VNVSKKYGSGAGSSTQSYLPQEMNKLKAEMEANPNLFMGEELEVKSQASESSQSAGSKRRSSRRASIDMVSYGRLRMPMKKEVVLHRQKQFSFYQQEILNARQSDQVDVLKLRELPNSKRASVGHQPQRLVYSKNFGQRHTA